METSFPAFMATPHLATLRRIAAALGRPSYVVGGSLRDILLGRAVNDVDVAVDGGAEKLSRGFASDCGGTLFPLDTVRGHFRVIIREEPGTVTFDFAPLKGSGILEDLALRDFTINALAVPLQGNVELMDPLNGSADICAKQVRCCSEAAFRDDPLRLVRAFRFAATLGFHIEPGTLAAIPAHAPLIAHCAGERIRDELFRILAMPDASSFFRTMGESGLLFSVFGLLPARISSAVEAMDRVQKVAQSVLLFGVESAAKVESRLRQEVQEGITVLSIMKLAAFLAAVQIAPYGAVERLKLGKVGGQLVEKLYCAGTLPMSGHYDAVSAYRLFTGCDPAGEELPLMLLALGRISELCCCELIDYYQHRHIPRGGILLLSGSEIMALLSAPPGRIVGEAQGLLREAQSTGEVRTVAEARDFLRKKLLTTNGPMG